jgi:hypothetical protein
LCLAKILQIQRRKIMKKIIALLAAIAVTASLTACGDSGVSRDEHDRLQREVDRIGRELEEFRNEFGSTAPDSSAAPDTSAPADVTTPLTTAPTAPTSDATTYDWEASGLESRTVPNFVGLEREAAAALARDNNLTPQISLASSSEEQRGRVVAQSVAAGTRVPINAVVELTVGE